MDWLWPLETRDGDELEKIRSWRGFVVRFRFKIQIVRAVEGQYVWRRV